MISRRALLVVLALTLTGCFDKSQAMVDLSAAVFIIFLFLVCFKYFFPFIAGSRWVQYFSEALKKNAHSFIIPLYAVAACIVVAGIILSGINKILIFIGFAVGVIAVFLTRYTTQETQENKKRMLEIVFLGIGVLFVLTLMLILGPTIFSAF